jgi:hypothetical protein
MDATINVFHSGLQYVRLQNVSPNFKILHRESFRASVRLLCVPLQKLSYKMTTATSSFNNSTTTCEPIKPTPPMTRVRFALIYVAKSFFASDDLDRDYKMKFELAL